MVAIGKHFCGRYDQEEEKEEVLPEWPAEVEAGDIEQPDRATQGYSYMKYAMRERLGCSVAQKLWTAELR